MAQKPETVFRTGTVLPFLQKLKNTAVFPIQQMSFVGDPDYLLCCRGRFVALELKDVDEEPRKIQEYKLSEVRRTGGRALVADRKTWAAVKAVLLKLDAGEDV